MLSLEETVYHVMFMECLAFPRLLYLVYLLNQFNEIEYRVKKAKELGLPIPIREAAVIRNPQQEFAAALEEKRTKSQIADSVATMVCVL